MPRRTRPRTRTGMWIDERLVDWLRGVADLYGTRPAFVLEEILEQVSARLHPTVGLPAGCAYLGAPSFLDEAGRERLHDALLELD